MKAVDPKINVALVPEGSRPVLVCDAQNIHPQLPTIRTTRHHVITRWRLNKKEREAVANGEDVFVTLLTDGPLSPMFVSIGPVDWTR